MALVIVPPAPVSGEVLAPDGTVPLHQLPPRQRLHRDDAAVPAEIVVPASTPQPVIAPHVGSRPMARSVVPVAALRAVGPSRRAHRASSLLSNTMLAGLALAVGLACMDDKAFAPAAADGNAAGAKTYTMRVTALPTLVIEPQAVATKHASHHVMAVAAPVSTLLPRLSASAQFLRTTLPAAHHHHAAPLQGIATTQTTLASSTTIAASGTVLGSLAAPAPDGPHVRHGHHVGTSLARTDMQALTPPATLPGVTSVQRPDTAARGKRSTSAPSPIVPAVKRAAPTKQAFARIDAATRTSLGARPTVAAKQQAAGDDWRGALRSQQ